jgi:hypothetical protein
VHFLARRDRALSRKTGELRNGLFSGKDLYGWRTMVDYIELTKKENVIGVIMNGDPKSGAFTPRIEVFC